SGTGAFTLALAELLPPDALILSVDRDRGALRRQQTEMERRYPAFATRVAYLEADFTTIEPPPLDGIVMANAAHFCPCAPQPLVLARLVAHLVPAGRFIVVEYAADEGNPWVPYPISLRRWDLLSVEAGLADGHEIGRRPSRFLGSIYSAVAVRS